MKVVGRTVREYMNTAAKEYNWEIKKIERREWKKKVKEKTEGERKRKLWIKQIKIF